MNLIQTIIVAFSMYSAIPMPRFEWTEKNMKYAMCAFPLIGPVIGAVMILAIRLGEWFALPSLLMGAIFCLIPIGITGGIHMDGFLDTEDSLASHTDAERKLEIMKDPHVGSFAVIKVICFFLITYALWATITVERPLLFLFFFGLSRALSGFAVCSFPLAKNTGLAYLFSQAADKKRARVILLVWILFMASGMIFFGRVAGALAVILAILTFGYYYGMSKKQFGGITGDLAGWFLQVCELMMLLGIYASPYLEKLL